MGKDFATTISVGFRAPDFKSLVTALWQDTCKSMDSDRFYSDVADMPTPPVSPGLLSQQACNSMSRTVSDLVSNTCVNFIFIQSNLN